MGVHGLWRLIEPSGKPVPLETLENKVLAVDVSLWLHQAVKGFQDSKGAPLPNAHLLGIYHRVCKLLYFKIKPVFIFDGGVPVLKKQTIAKRNQLKSRYQTDADKLQKQLINTLLKHTAITNVLSEKTKASISPTKKSTKVDAQHDLYALPEATLDTASSSSEEVMYSESDDESSPTQHLNIHNIDTESKEFKTLPADVRYDILSEVKETRKQSSWGRLHEMPTKSDDFSTYQMGRLLQRQNVQSELEKTEKEMGGHSLSLGELESLLKDQGVISKNDSVGQRIASDENTRFLLIKDIKQAIEDARNKDVATTSEKLESINESDENSFEGKDSENMKDIKRCSKKLFIKQVESSSKNQEIEVDFKGQDSEEISMHDLIQNGDVSSKSNKNKADLEYEVNLHKAIKLSMLESGESSKMSLDSAINSLFEECDQSRLEKKCQLEDTSQDSDYEEELQKAIQLSLECNTENQVAHEKPTENQNNDTVVDISVISEDSDSDSNNEEQNEDMTKLVSSAQRYMLEYSGLTPHEIAKIIRQNCDKNNSDNKEKLKKHVKTSSSNKKCKSKALISDKVEKQPTDSKEGDLSLKTNSSAKTIHEDIVEVMSDSEDSDDFVEIKNERQSKSKESHEKNNIEILIKPGEVVEDDLFSDIFNDMKGKADLGKEHTNQKLVDINIKDKSEVQEHLSSKTPEVISDLEEEDNQVSPLPVVTIDSSISQKITEGKVEEKIEALESLKNKIEEQLFKLHSDEVYGEDKPSDANKNQEDKSKYFSKSTQEKEVSSTLPDEKIIVTTVSENTIKIPETPKLSVSEMEEMKEALRKEQYQLQTEKSLKERLAGNITDQMYQEAQELLQLFGVPFIRAPMEAEAQCAFLDEINLTDGTITDDSDIWLFGGKTVYKNFFNQSKLVMEFRAENILHHFKLTREQMILFAFLVGSDYTIGLQGIGPVTALEILATFPPPSSSGPSSSSTEFSLTHNQLLSGLGEFRNWLSKGKAPGVGRTGLRSKLKNIKFTENFPNIQVLEAYLDPKVETSREQFTWATPDIVGLQDFARHKFGWTAKKSEEILSPVIKRLQERQSQKTIRDYFKTKTKIISNEPENRMSKRVRAAVKRIGNEPSEEEEPKPKQKRTRKKKTEKNADQSGEGASENTEKLGEMMEDDILNELLDVIESKSTEKPAKPKRGRKPKKKDNDIKDLAADEDVKVLQESASHSAKRVKEISAELKKILEQSEKTVPKLKPNLHKKEVIPQRERDKTQVLKTKLKAIEIFRKSQKGPGYVKKRIMKKATPKQDAGLSESSSDEN